MSYKEDTLRFNSKSDSTVKCKCGHSLLIQKQTDRVLCSWCGKYAYRTPLLEFKYKLAMAERKLK